MSTSLPSPASSVSRRSGSRPSLILIVLMLIEGGGMFEQTMVLGGIPFFAKLFSVDLTAIAWMVTAFTLVGAAAAVVAGRLGDIYGRKPVIIVIMLLGIAGSLVALFGGSFPALIIGRILQGTSLGLLPLLIGIARETQPAHRVPGAVALLTATATIMAGVGIFVGGIFLDSGQWHGIFIVTASACAACLVLAIVILPRHRPAPAGTRLDIVGAVLFAPGIAAILYGITMLRAGSITSLAVAGPILIGIVILTVWVLWELRVTNPLVNIRALGQPMLRLVMIAVLIAGLAPLSALQIYSSLIALTPAELPVGIGLSATTYGLVSLGGAVVTFALTPIAGWIARRWGGAYSLIVGLLIFVATFALLATPAGYKSVPVVVGLIALSNVGNAFIVSSIYNIIIENVPQENTSEYTSVSQVIRSAAIAIGTVIVSLLLSSSTVQDSTAPTVEAWTSMTVYGLVVTLLALSVAVVLAVRRRRQRALPQTSADLDSVAA